MDNIKKNFKRGSSVEVFKPLEKKYDLTFYYFTTNDKPNASESHGINLFKVPFVIPTPEILTVRGPVAIEALRKSILAILLHHHHIYGSIGLPSSWLEHFDSPMKSKSTDDTTWMEIAERLVENRAFQAQKRRILKGLAIKDFAALHQDHSSSASLPLFRNEVDFYLRNGSVLCQGLSLADEPAAVER
jgi:hypothetical protein